jgi:RNA polymerase sigma factor (sigma-70 family)
LAELVGTNITNIGQLETLLRPFKDIDKLKALMFSVSDVLDMDLDTLFPADYLAALELDIIPRRRKPMLILRDVSIDALPPSSECLLLESAEDIVMSNPQEFTECITKILEQMPTREANVLKLRFGFNGDGIKTIDEVSRKFGVTRERIRQIEEQAMRRLRSPAHQRELSEWL